MRGIPTCFEDIHKQVSRYQLHYYRVLLFISYISNTTTSTTIATHHHHHQTHPSNNNSTTMSSQQSTDYMQYMYIPNLVGKQILRVPVLPCDEQTLATTPALTRSSSPVSPASPRPSLYSRESSPAPSVRSLESVRSVE